MGFLDRAIKNGISQGIGKAVGEAVEKVVAPKVEQMAGKAARQLDQATGAMSQQSAPAAGGFNGAFANLQRAAEGYATELSKGLKQCPACGEGTTADKQYCPSCGAKLPEETLAQSAVCPSCGKQNSIGTAFCTACGTKLPAAEAEEQALRSGDAAVMAKWDSLIPQYPKWTCGGTGFNLEEYDENVMFAARLPSAFAAKGAVEQYRELLLQNGFSQEGQYPSREHLYKKIGGVSYQVDTEHCFEGDSDCPTVYFYISDPPGGYGYVKPEPKKQLSFRDLKDLLR